MNHFEDLQGLTEDEGPQFNNLVIDKNTGRVYIGAVNKLYQLSPNLEPTVGLNNTCMRVNCLFSLGFGVGESREFVFSFNGSFTNSLSVSQPIGSLFQQLLCVSEYLEPFVASFCTFSQTKSILLLWISQGSCLQSIVTCFQT